MPSNGDGKRDRIILAMDKIRTHDSFPDKYIHINIPEYKLRFYINDSLKSDHNIVVGKYQDFFEKVVQ